jgi:methanogenic corrinoid protein MtbC1
MIMVSLVNAGYKVSEVGVLPDEKLHQLLDSAFTSTNSQTENYFIYQLLAAGMSFDIARFERIFERCVLRYRLKNTYRYVLLPMLERIGLLWKCDKATPAQEHFVSNLIVRKLLAAIDELPCAATGSEKWLLFLPENEFHELGLLAAYYLIRSAGHEVIYLGANTPWASLPAVMRDAKPDRILFFSLGGEMTKAGSSYLRDVEANFAGKKIYAAGLTYTTARAFGADRVIVLNSIEDLTKALAAI